MRKAIAIWAVLLVGFAAVLAAVRGAEHPPAPRGLDTPATEFSEARAWPTLNRLAEEIGPRILGTQGARRAREDLERQLRALPRMEVQVQENSQCWTYPGEETLSVFTTRNLLARLPGRSERAILVSAHYDSPPESVGAADDGMAIAAMLEVARALAASAPLEHTVIFNFNEGEEGGLFGSESFTHHPWMQQVQAFVNLEAAGARGKSYLFQSGPGNDWLLRAYARAAPFPAATVVGQDLFQSGAVPSDTDFRVYRDDAHRPGLDIAFILDGYAYHTDRDRVGRLEPGSLQHMGANLLALVRELASGALPELDHAPSGVYYDVLGWKMVVYGQRTAEGLALFTTLGVIAALVLANRRGGLTARGLGGGVLLALLTSLVGLGVPVLMALVLPLLHRSQGWFSAPWLAGWTFGSASLASALALHARWVRRSRAHAPAPSTWAGSLVLWTLALLGLTWLGVGSAYLFLGWALPGTLALALAVVRPRFFWGALVLALVPGTVLTLQSASLLLDLAVPIAGRFGESIPFDPIVAGLVALPVILCGGFARVAAERAGGLGWASAAWGGMALLGLLVIALHAPYSQERPKRLIVRHLERDGRAVLEFRGFDFVPMNDALRDVPGVAPVTEVLGQPTTRETFTAPAGVVSLPPATLEMSVPATSTSELREATLHLVQPEPGELEVWIPREALARWSLSCPLPTLDKEARHYKVTFFNPEEGARLTLGLKTPEPVTLDVHELRFTTTPELDAALAHLPRWTTAFAYVRRDHHILIPASGPGH